MESKAGTCTLMFAGVCAHVPRDSRAHISRAASPLTQLATNASTETVEDGSGA